MVFWSAEDTDVIQEKCKIVISGNRLDKPKNKALDAWDWFRNNTETVAFRFKEKTRTLISSSVLQLINSNTNFAKTKLIEFPSHARFHWRNSAFTQILL